MKTGKIRKDKVNIITLGCSKNLVDSEVLSGQLRANDIAVVHENERLDHNIVVVNTCGFIEKAKEESINTILEQVSLKQSGRLDKVYVTGCLSQRYRDDLQAEIPEVDAWFGTMELPLMLKRFDADYRSELIGERFLSTPQHYAYLKISEGCNHRCTFCVIPSMRGDLVSRPVGEVMQEAEHLVRAGVKELLIISQDTSAYGVDVRYRTGFWGGRPVRTRMTELVNALAELGVWVRLHYVYPYPHVDEIVPLMAEGRVVPYLDVPFQHASERILKLMKRPASAHNNLERIRAWRALCPDLTIRSTFIVGFPGETEAEFEELLEFLEQAQLDRVGCFAYSPVEGAAANALPDPVSEEVKQQRRARFMLAQERISASRLAAKVGRTLTVLVDAVQGQQVTARSTADAPEIDGVVHVRHADRARPGDFLRVKVWKSDTHDLHAQPAPS